MSAEEIAMLVDLVERLGISGVLVLVLMSERRRYDAEIAWYRSQFERMIANVLERHDGDEA